MKKILFLLMALAAIVPARADRYFSLRYDTITADVDRDGVITIADITEIIDMVAS